MIWLREPNRLRRPRRRRGRPRIDIQRGPLGGVRSVLAKAGASLIDWKQATARAEHAAMNAAHAMAVASMAADAKGCCGDLWIEALKQMPPGAGTTRQQREIARRFRCNFIAVDWKALGKSCGGEVRGAASMAE